MTAGHHAGGALSPTRPASLPLSSFNILQRTDHAPGPGPETEVVQTPVPLPSHHSALSRAFVKTIGRLGRWKRVLNSRSAARTSISACAGASAFDLELSLSRDLLTVNGGVEQYLGMAGPQSSWRHIPALPSTTPVLPPVVSSQQHNPATSSVPTVIPAEKPVSAPVQSYESPSEATPLSNEEFTPSTISTQDQEPLVTDEAEAQVPVQGEDDYDIVRSSERAESFHSSSTDSLGEPLQPGIPSTFSPPSQSQWQFDVVSIDDLDLSDTSSEVHEAGPAAPPGLRRLPRKLPMRRDFEFVRRSEVSSMGIVSHNSMASGPSSSTPSSGGLGHLAQWQINAIVDSLTDDGEGDVDDALRRLEGQINPQKVQEKASKVDGWVRTIRERMAAGDYTNEEPRFPTDSDSDEEVVDDANEDDEEDRHESMSVHNLPNSTPSIIVPDDLNEEDQEGAFDSARTPIPTQSVHMIPHPPGLESAPQPTDVGKPELEVEVPSEVIPDQVISPTTKTTTLASFRPETVLSSKFANPDAPRIHKSFVLSCRTTTLAEHFTMIDRELFMGIKFEELVTDDWMACEEVSVLDWAQYQKDRAKWKAESRFPEKTSALAAVRARFNLMAHFVISEIVLTQPADRYHVVAKFLRVAWKCYEMSSLNTLTAIITALQNDWVNRAMRRVGWNKLPSFETRVFKILKDFTTNADEFKFIRKLVESIVESKPLENGSRAASVVSGGNTDHSSKGKAATDKAHIPTACVPFFGIYLAQLYKINKLPALIDPTAPNQGVGIDPISATFDPPAHPEVFSALAPLPATMNLEPLINVHKQRRIAAVIKSLVAGQHLASRIHYEVDKKLFPRCLRLRGLDSDTLQLVFDTYSDQ